MVRMIYDGPGVLPGRYSGPGIAVHVGPTPQQVALDEEQADASALAGQICAAAAMSAQSECQLLELIGEFDATRAIRWWTDMKSLAHWLSWACSMSPGVAREHVRIAKALRRMPTVREAFRAGRLSYSKVREVTRVVDSVDEERLCELALTATASQLARMISAYRAADGSRIRQERKRSLTWQTREDGMVDFRASLPAEEAATLIAAITAAQDQFGTPPEKPNPELPTDAAESEDTGRRYSSADALLDVARVFLDTAPEDRSGEDRNLVVVHLSGENLSEAKAENVPAGTFGEAEDVPAGTSPKTPAGDATCHIEGVAPIEPETARRLACDSPILGAVVDQHGEVLALGRTRRLVSRAQRRALMIRDRMCRFPGCSQTRHLKAHHRVSWANGGSTDLDNLILLCQWHHTAVHEGGMTIRRAPGGAWDSLCPTERSIGPGTTLRRSRSC